MKEKFRTSNVKQLFKVVDGIFTGKSSPPLLTHDSLEHLVESFGNFFKSKIIDIKHSLSQKPSRPKRVTNVLYSTLSVSLIMSLLMVLRLSFSHQKVKVVFSIHYLLGC